MDLASLVGVLGAFGIVIMAMILGGDISMFVNVPSILIVVVGSMFAVLMKFELGQFLGAFKIAGKAFAFKLVKPKASSCSWMAMTQTWCAPYSVKK